MSVKAQPKRWIDTEIFTDCVKHLRIENPLFRTVKVAFIVDDFTAHPDAPGLTGIDLIFLLTNTTPVT